MNSRRSVDTFSKEMHMNTTQVVIVTALGILVPVYFAAKHVIAYINNAEQKSAARELARNLGRRFPEFADEFTIDRMEKLLPLKDARAKEIEKWDGNAVLDYDEVEERFPISGRMRPIMSKRFCDFVSADIVREKMVSAAIFNSILIGGNAKLRVWVDENGNNRLSTSDGPPPAWW